MLKNFKYRIYPTSAQETKLESTLDICRFVWNHYLDQRIEFHKQEKKISQYDQSKDLTIFKKDHTELKSVHSQVLQNVIERLDLSFKAFFRRVRNKENPGFPRFKGKNRLQSFCYPQLGFKVNENKVFLSKIGHIKLILHRELEGKVKRCTVKKSITGKWFVVFSCEIEQKKRKRVRRNPVGIDVGIKSFAVLSDGTTIENPKFFKRDKKDLARSQRKHEKKKTKKTKKVIGRIHERIFNRRENFSHQLSRKIVRRYHPICIEDLDINQMKDGNFKSLNREISDTAWSSFFNKISYKAENAGKKLIKVNPAYTSQDCSSCGYRVKKKLSDRIHKCPNCNLEMDRDLNASLNILRLGLQSLQY